MSVYREKEWTTPGEKKKLRTARIKSSASIAGALGAGALATRTRSPLAGSVAGATAFGLGAGNMERYHKMNPTMNRAFGRYKRAGGTDDVPDYKPRKR